MWAELVLFCIGSYKGENIWKLVYVRHNLKQHLKNGVVRKNQTIYEENDLWALLIDATLFGETNSIMEWLSKPGIEDDDISLEEMFSRLKKRKLLLYRGGNKNKGKWIVENGDDHIEHKDENDESSLQGNIVYVDSSHAFK